MTGWLVAAWSMCANAKNYNFLENKIVELDTFDLCVGQNIECYCCCYCWCICWNGDAESAKTNCFHRFHTPNRCVSIYFRLSHFLNSIFWMQCTLHKTHIITFSLRNGKIRCRWNCARFYFISFAFYILLFILHICSLRVLFSFLVVRARDFRLFFLFSVW